MPVVTFRTDSDGPDRGDPVRAEVAPGATVHDAARAGGVCLVSPCGGAGRCGRCVVEVVGPAPEPTAPERERLSADDIAKGRRMACELAVTRDIEVVVPASSLGAIPGILEEGDCVPFPLETSVTVRGCALHEPSLADPRPDLERLAACLGDGNPAFALECELGASRALPEVLRANGFSAELVLRGGRLLDVRPPGDGARALGAAFDIGTTTVAGALVDLATGERLGLGSRTNPQHAVGDDVVSRMDYAARGPAELAELQRRIGECLNGLLDELARSAGALPGEVYDLVVAGNTVMKHLFLGLPPQAMATVPFTPVVTAAVDVAAAELGLRAAPSARVWTTPAVSAYVGGDIVAGLVAVGFGGFRDDTLYIDIGTNGEVVAGRGERAFCSATAAGPAFEGARISMGMRAVPGAISHARL
ncbi:MAG: ASKHA domain-containing protein, partial [Planctomycetota bacterium]